MLDSARIASTFAGEQPRRLAMSAACPSPAPLTIGERGLVALLAVALSLAMGARSLPDALDGGYVNPDSTMRLARLVLPYSVMTHFQLRNY